jgi:redox-sensitive bicupin YhaK (pirin superfamily)
MITPRPAAERGTTRIGWHESHHSFSFGEYHDVRFLGFRSLRVINDDIVAPGEGFGMHGHRDMEIITVVLDGELEHKDSLGNGEVLRPGEVQMMTAGTGIRHSEFNPSQTKPVHLLQIWLMPDEKNAKPRYAQKQYPIANRRGKLVTVASPDGRDGSLPIHQDATLAVTLLEPGDSVTHTLAPGRFAWVQIATGAATLNGRQFSAGDGASIADEKTLTLTGTAPGTHVLLFDLA